MMHQFIWQKKPYCRKDHAKARLEKGGFDLIDMKSSLRSFHASWLRRLYLNYNSDKEWVYIVKNMLIDIDIKPKELWNLGTKTFKYIAKKIKSDFWKKVFETAHLIADIENESNVDFIMNQNIWDSHIFYEKGNPLTKKDYGSLKTQINRPIDMIKIINGKWPKWLTPAELCKRYGSLIQTGQYEKIKEKITTILQKRNLSIKDITPAFPQQTSMAMIATMQMKGCNKWKRKFLQKYNKKINTEELEQKHNQQLNLNIPRIEFSRIYRNMRTLNYDNKLKFFQFTINRNTIKTNYILSKYKHHINPKCSFCNQHDETINHLFWECPVTSYFIYRCTQFLYATHDDAHNIITNLTKKNFFFGIQKEGFNDVNNYLLMLIKKFIWNKRCFKVHPQLEDFKKYMKTEITHQMNANLSPKSELRIKILESTGFKNFVELL